MTGDRTPAEPLAPLAAVIGRWRSSGTVFDEQGSEVGEIAGTDTYTWAPGGLWIVHEVDVRVAGEPTQAVELIGGGDVAGGWQMYAFGAGPDPELTRLTAYEPGLLLLQGDGIRSWFRPEAGPDQMTTRWEKQVGEAWVRWMDMRFDRDS